MKTKKQNSGGSTGNVRADQILKTWAIPLGFQVFGQEIGDHTWVAGDAGFGAGCRFGTVSEPDPYYCSPSRWSGGKYTPPSADSRELEHGTDSENTAKCMYGTAYSFMGIPSQCGIVYIINGVCHNLANRTLYPSNVTVNGARGYWFTQSIYGTYGTMVPLALIPSVIPVWFPPFIIPNPLYVAALAWTVAIEIDWAVRRGNCGVSMLQATEKNEWNDYIRSVQELYIEPLSAAAKKEWTASELFDLQEKMQARHMKEIELTLEYRGSNVSSAKRADLLKLWDDFHKPSRADLDVFFGKNASMNFAGLPDANIGEVDSHLLANVVNTAAGEQLKKVIDLLGPDDFRSIYGHAPEERFLIADPTILKTGTAALKKGKQ